jgi:CDP-diacylglycerol--serine O-phosphatidyltransferase
MQIKKHIPNFITMLNLFCGIVATIYAVNNQLEMAALFVGMGIFFDFFDGLAARVLNVQSALGIQLDSLADMVTSGLVPGIVMMQLLHLSIDSWDDAFLCDNLFSGHCSYVPFFGLLITMASAYRLAKFNIDEEQQSSFMGLPTPANALFILSLPLIMAYQGNDLFNETITNKWFLIVVTLISCYMLNARIPLFALKFKTWGFKENAIRYIFLILCIVLLTVLHFAAVPLIIVLYVLMSLIDKKKVNK